MTWTIWRCSICSTEYPYKDIGSKHGGPRERGLDRRYGFLASCWRAKATHCRSKGLTNKRILLVSEGAPNPEQPVQDPADIQWGPKRKEKK